MLILFVSLVLNSNAQTTLYLNPKLGAAFSFTSSKILGQPKYTPLGGTIISPYSLSKNFNFLKAPTVPRGLALGIILNNKRHKIELEWEKSSISYKVETFVSDYRYADKAYEVLSSSINEKINSFYVNYAYQITKDISKTSIWLKVAPGVSFSSLFDLYMGKNYSNFHLTPNVHLDYINFQPVSQTNVTANIKVGFDVDFYRKERYILSLSLNYAQGFGKLQRNELHIGYTKYNDDFSVNEVKDFSREIYSRGSNFQLSISRRFQLYPWRPNKKINEI